MKRFLFLCIFSLFFLNTIRATHNMAGEITYKCLGGNTYEITITTYTRISSLADRCDLTVFFGDGDSAVVKRMNGSTFVKCGFPVPDGEPVTPEIKKNVYKTTHTFSGASCYTIWMQDPNRIENVVNIPNSVNVPFALKTKLCINPLMGCNNSPDLLNPPIDNACVGACFYHNPGANDPDGDSLSYKLTTCLGSNGFPIPGYTYPASSGTFKVDPLTGDLEWCSPVAFGIYNVAIIIEEWRTFLGHRYLVGTVERDLSIDVQEFCSNNPPVIADVKDTCVEAGSILTFTVKASDPDGNNITLSATGAPLNTVLPQKAIFGISTGVNPFSKPFKWNTGCDHVRKQPYMVSFKAVDVNPTPLADFETVFITVVAPAPKNPSATPLGTSMKIKWNKSKCDPSGNVFSCYKIYRKISPSGWNPNYCETGVPAYAGYTQIGSICVTNGKSINDTTFTDNNNGAGLAHGVTYCYRIVADFQDGAQSYASVEFCNQLKRDIPMITNVDVVSTGTNDSILVRWVKPYANVNDFDTLIHPGPYKFELYQSPGYVLSQPTLLQTFTTGVFRGWKDTAYISAAINTQDSAYSYRIKFYAGGGLDTIGNSQIASSVYLSAVPSDNQLALSWQFIVPWTNTKYYLYKKGPYDIAYNLFDSTAAMQYTDDSLVNGATYCYYVRSYGAYSDTSLPHPLFNRSEKMCGVPADKTPPCAPTLTVTPDCIGGTDGLKWNNPNNSCSDDVVKYNIYYAAMEGDPFVLLFSKNDPNDTIWQYNNAASIAGCFKVAAVDSFDNQSLDPAIVCVDNCPVYELPNVFSPEGDEKNDLFSAILPYRYIKDVDMKIYNRWGQLMYETTNPDINWNGKDKASNQLCSDGTYYYVCIVHEIRVNGIIPTERKGFIQLFTGKNGLSK